MPFSSFLFYLYYFCYYYAVISVAFAIVCNASPPHSSRGIIPAGDASLVDASKDIHNISIPTSTLNPPPPQVEVDRAVHCSFLNFDSYCCYYSDHPERVKCLPRLIIAGTQKSGSTVLSAILSNHPEIFFSPKKEVHFFDQPSRVVNFTNVQSYLKYFDFYDTSLAPITTKGRDTGEADIFANTSIPRFAEATPFYVSSMTACQKMSYVVPKVKLVILMRDPVYRAYSEYQMKIRRVEIQNDFIKILTTNLLTMYRCLTHTSWGSEDGVTSSFAEFKSNDSWGHMERACFPDELVSHPYWLNFRKVFLKTIINISSSSNADFISSSSSGHQSSEAPNKNNDKSTESKLIDKQHILWKKLINKCFIVSHDDKIAAKRAHFNNVARSNFNVRPNFEKSDFKRRKLIPHDSRRSKNASSNLDLPIYLKELSSNDFTAPSFISSSSSNSNRSNSSEEASLFSYDSCISQCNIAYDYKCLHCSHLKHPDVIRRSLIPLQKDSLAHDIPINNINNNNKNASIYRKFRRFAGSEPPSNSDNIISLDTKNCLGLEAVKSLTDAFGEEIRNFQKCAIELNHTSSVAELYKATKKCLVVNSGIQDQYFYRSLYAVQIYNCQRFFTSDQFIFLSNEEMQKFPLETIKKLLIFLGVRDVDYFDDKQELLSPKGIQNSVDSHFPTFERKSGWKLDSGYRKMPLFLESYLRSFFKPYNQLLYSLIGQNFTDYWS